MWRNTNMTVALSLNRNNFHCCSVPDFKKDFPVADKVYAQIMYFLYNIDFISYISSVT